MSNNAEIRANLQTTIEQFSNDFLAIVPTCYTFENLFLQLQNANKSNYEDHLLTELLSNCKDWWTSIDRGVDPTVELYAILFEYDYDIFKKDNEASSYGISEWQDFQVQTEDFSMGYDYDFAKNFEAYPGVTLRMFGPLEELSGENLSKDLKNKDVTEEPGYSEIIGAFRYSNYLCLHNALDRFSKTNEFRQLNIKKNFMFLIGEHDFGEVTPLWIAE